jgi:hypothetical protein
MVHGVIEALTMVHGVMVIMALGITLILAIRPPGVIKIILGVTTLGGILRGVTTAITELFLHQQILVQQMPSK